MSKLYINLFNVRCGDCSAPVDRDATEHECGAVFTEVSTDNDYPGLIEDMKRLRPDLTLDPELKDRL